MKVIYETEVLHVPLRFNKVGVILDASHNLDDAGTRNIYKFGQQLHPTILTLHKIHGRMLPSGINQAVASFPQSQRERAREILETASRTMTKAYYNSLGYVYLIRHATEPGLYKIGKTNNPSNRLKTFNVKLPFEVDYEILIQTDNMTRVEKEWHDHFSHRRINGEWFALDEQDVKWMRQHDYRRQEWSELYPTPDEIEIWEKHYGLRGNE